MDLTHKYNIRLNMNLAIDILHIHLLLIYYDDEFIGEERYTLLLINLIFFSYIIIVNDL